MRIILRNILSTWLGYLFTFSIGFLLAPFVVHHLGNTGYGVWTLIISLSGYFGILDLGLRSSVGRFVARNLALNDHEGVNRTVSTALAMLAAAGTLALLATGVMSLDFGIFKVDPQFSSTARAALIIAGLNISLILPFSVSSAVLVSLERFDVINGITILGGLTRAALVVTFLRLDYGLVALALITALVSMSEYTAMAVAVKVLYRPLRPGWRYVDLTICRDLFGFGIYRFIWIVANQLIFYTDSVVIGLFINAAAITYYTIGGSLINYGRNIVSAATDTLYPSASRLDAKNDMAGLQELLIMGTRIALLVGIPLCLGFLFLGRQFIGLWMGKGYEISATVLIVLTIPQLTSMSQYVSALVLAAMAKHRILAYIVVAEGVVNLALSIVLARRMGVIGVAWGTVIPHAITTALVIPLYTLRMVRMAPSRYLREAFGRPLLCALPTAGLCYALSVLVVNPSWLGFGLEVIAVCASFAILSYFICLTAEQRILVIDKCRRRFRREPLLTS